MPATTKVINLNFVYVASKGFCNYGSKRGEGGFNGTLSISEASKLRSEGRFPSPCPHSSSNSSLPHARPSSQPLLAQSTFTACENGLAQLDHHTTKTQVLYVAHSGYSETHADYS